MATAEALRCLRYRLRRQGMMELEHWLASLEEPLAAGDLDPAAVSDLLALEVPVLLEMLQEKCPVPEHFGRWLAP